MGSFELAVMLLLVFAAAYTVILACVMVCMRLPKRLRACPCGAHWWIRRWGFWRHLDASPFNDQLQNRWTIWMFEFRTTLVLTQDDMEVMGYPDGPIWEDGRPMWQKSKRQLLFSSRSYCARCGPH